MSATVGLVAVGHVGDGDRDTKRGEILLGGNDLGGKFVGG